MIGVRRRRCVIGVSWSRQTARLCSGPSVSALCSELGEVVPGEVGDRLARGAMIGRYVRGLACGVVADKPAVVQALVEGSQCRPAHLDAAASVLAALVGEEPPEVGGSSGGRVSSASRLDPRFEGVRRPAICETAAAIRDDLE